MAIQAHNAELYLALLNKSDYSPPHPKRKSGSTSSAANAQREAFMAKQKVREEEHKRMFEIARKETERRVLDNQRKRDQKFEDGFKSLKNERASFVEQVRNSLAERDARTERRKEKLYNEWQEKVFYPIQDSIENAVESEAFETLQARKRMHFQAYLDEVEKKGRVFRDIVIESEYDPLASRKEFKRVSTLKDCEKRDPTQNQRDLERIDQAEVYGKLPPVNFRPKAAQRETLKPQLWSVVEATPHGRYSSPTQHCVKMVKQDLVAGTHGIVMDDYDFPIGEVAKQYRKVENGRGKKVIGPVSVPPKPDVHGKKHVPAPGKRHQLTI